MNSVIIQAIKTYSICNSAAIKFASPNVDEFQSKRQWKMNNRNDFKVVRRKRTISIENEEISFDSTKGGKESVRRQRIGDCKLIQDNTKCQIMNNK